MKKGSTPESIASRRGTREEGEKWWFQNGKRRERYDLLGVQAMQEKI